MEYEYPYTCSSHVPHTYLRLHLLIHPVGRYRNNQFHFRPVRLYPIPIECSVKITTIKSIAYSLAIHYIEKSETN